MDWTKQQIIRACSFVLFIVVLVICFLFLPTECEKPVQKDGSPHRHRLDLAEGVSLSRHGCFGLQFVRCGRCRLEKRKLGGLTFAGYNELVLEDLAVILPPSSIDENSNRDDRPADAVALTEFMGLDDGFLRSRGFKMKFSGLRIHRLAVSTLDSSTNAVPQFVAARGDAERNGLRLRGCGVITGAETNWVGDAVLQIKPRPKLAWQGGERRL